MTTFDDIDQMCLEMVTAGFDPGGIVGSPRQIKRLFAEAQSGQMCSDPTNSGSGWKYNGLPVYRSYEISGPCVVTKDALAAMRGWGRNRCGRLTDTLMVDRIAPFEQNPVLF